MATTLWNIDTTHTGIHFSVRHMVVAKVRGSFTKFGGTITLDDANPAASSVSVSIEAASISTGVEQRDNHLRSPDFFDVAQFPALTFQSTKVEPSGKHLKVTGQLTIRGISREVVLEAEQLGIAKDPWGNTKAAFEAKTSINRGDFGLTWNQALEAGGVLVGEKIEIALEVQAAQAQSGEKAA
ncbi:polyisoprenoid-binding protein [Corallococcus sp. AB049A]|uniref:Polyisoprenoid-binding protein n=1 Tax=Corallococcus interemptor TaxID=2316720 RepID=A0A3A8QS55_9BACT|nr:MULTISPECIES: YceI family protein [Corallococcus]RKH42304.1 polyisoprenoid-binding protein [Corallococcus sp. AB050B]RKH71367.1 polyisoprenoid-binding protein [Corallococcus interemptor]RKI63507.1 polyisoprenoid-binding protein [Corallococcus sp. AB049A]